MTRYLFLQMLEAHMSGGQIYGQHKIVNTLEIETNFESKLRTEKKNKPKKKAEWCTCGVHVTDSEMSATDMLMSYNTTEEL